ncbi:armadillo-type protein [Mycena latifolia]|nr:armadillo-type protein [Mycena latifolia]
MVRQLVCNRFTATTVLVANRCAAGLVARLRDGTEEVVSSAIQALYWICQFPEGRQAAVNANVAVHLAELLASPDVEVQWQTCRIAEALAGDKSTAMAVFVGEVCVKLISLLCDVNSEVILSAADALYRIARSPNGAQAIVDANILDFVAQPLHS